MTSSTREELKIRWTSRLARLVNASFQATYRVRAADTTYAARRACGEDVRCIYATWHGYLWHGIHAVRGGDVCVMVSSHRDGEIIARVLSMMGFSLARGSSTRGGAAALREFVRFARDTEGDLVVTMDGPRGPYRELKDGILYAASRTGMPIVPLGMWVPKAWHTKSWDRMIVGKPFGRVGVAFGEALTVPRDASREELESTWRTRVAAAMDAAEERARMVLAGEIAVDRV